MRVEERFHLAPHLDVVATLAIEHRAQRRWIAVERGGEDQLHTLPVFGRRLGGPETSFVWRQRAIGHACSSRFNQARARVQSRLTVAGEMPSASAVSSTLIPP